MSNPYAALLRPGRIGTMELRNRIIMGPMGDSFAEEGGYCGERTQAYYEARAKGGAALVTMGVCSVAYPAGTSEPHQIGLSRDEFIPGLAALAKRVHKHGGKIAMQLHHGGKVSANDITAGRELWVPSIPSAHKSDILEAVTREELALFVGNLSRAQPRLRVMDEADIAQMVEYFAAAAARAQAAGMDGVEIHGAHNYILAGFLSPAFNHRDDAWGGPLENRARLLLDTIRAVKARTAGGKFAVWVRLDGEELHTPGGITLDNAVATARLAVAAGADAVHMSAEATITTGTDFTDAPIPQRPEAFVPYAKAVRAAVNVPVIATGRIEPESATRSIAAGEYDFLAMARKMLADPDIPNKLAANRPQDIRPCIYCYVCVSEIFVNRRVKCAVNAQTGHEYEHAIEPAAEPRHVLIVGGGPAGMEAARVAALRGHRVTLLERSKRLGGTLFFAGLAYPENGRLLDYLVAQMNHPRIEVRLDTEATPELLDELHPDRVIVATGARRAAPKIPGAEQRHVWSGDELRRLMTGDGADEIARAKLSLAERALFKAGGMIGAVDSRQALQGLSKLWMPLGKRVVIVGGGLVGLELAEFLLARGREVTVLLAAVRRDGTLQLKASVQAIGKHDVQWHDGDGNSHTTPADSVILAIGAEPDDGLARRLEDHGIAVQAIGDGASLGYIDGAMHQGNEAGRTV